ncbi:Cytochrome b5 [Durusdinium trenchii]|uniref:Cytochrome b5 n=1 Tax=Durusdinium trenchii TaxID=1381693 RepID=A0ABP0RCF2_9DINO
MESVSEAESERFDRQWRELKERYGPFRWSEAEQRWSSTALEVPRRPRSEAVEPWIDAITGLSEAVLRKDLEKVDDVLNLDSKFKFGVPEWAAFMETLKGELLPQRLTALTSLRQTGIPEAVEVLGLLLRELWARITGGNSKLCDQETTQLQRLLDLMQKAIADWDRVKDPNQIEWRGHFCGPIWSLRQSRGKGPPGPVDYDVVLEDLRDLAEKVRGILTSRQTPVEQPPASEGARPSAPQVPEQVGVEDELRRMRQDLTELKGLTLSLKEEVSTLHQDKLQMKEELEKLMSENYILKCQMTEMDDRLKKMENESSAEKELRPRLQSEHLRMKDELMELQNEKLKMKEELQEVKSDNESLKHPIARVEEEMKELKKEISIAQESQQSLTHLQVEVNQIVQLEETLKRLASELLSTKAELQEFRLQQDASGMKAGLEKLDLQRELLNMKKDLHETEFSDASSDASWVQIQQDQETPMQLSASSGFSVDTSGSRCFVLNTIFKTPTGSFLSGPQLLKDTQILAADGSTALVVASPPEQHAARGTVILEANEAKLQVTTDHRVVLATGDLVSAAQLKVGDEVVADGVPTKLTAVDFVPGEVPVLKITFQPDLPVAVFHPRPCIHSHGHKPKKIRRGGKHYRMIKEGTAAAEFDWHSSEPRGGSQRIVVGHYVG